MESEVLGEFHGEGSKMSLEYCLIRLALLGTFSIGMEKGWNERQSFYPSAEADGNEGEICCWSGDQQLRRNGMRGTLFYPSASR